MQIKGSVALVTGANRGLGLAYARALLAAGAAKVYAGSRDPAAVTTPGLVPVQLDVNDPVSVAAAAVTCADATIVINNAGQSQTDTLLSATGASTLHGLLETNVFGPLRVSQAFAGVLKANGGGALVNMLSVLSWLNLPSAPAYSISKAAAWSLTNGLRNELRGQGTLVIGVHAGFIDTDMTKHVQAPKARPEDIAAAVIEALAAGREEVLADDLSRQVKADLSSERAVYVREFGT